jgi:hypothetical protein
MQLFRTLEPGSFSAFDDDEEDGLPTLDAAGQPLSKSLRKKLQKRLEKHRRAYDKFHGRAQS